MNDSQREIEPRFRHTLRGLKRCSCGTINGQRALICRNIHCEIRIKTLASQRPFDPIKLVTHTDTAFYYSLRSKERNPQPRNFVHISEVTLALEPNSAIVSRNAICFVDTCKYDASDAAGITCKHIKACSSESTKSAGVLPQAEEYPVAREVLWNLNISAEQKQRLWKMYKDDEPLVPAVQRLNATTFAVKCTQSKAFPAGRLHVTAISNSISSKKWTHGCACKKLKIIVEPDNSVVMQEEVCDHILLVLSAILSKQNGKVSYENFTNSLKSFWMPDTLDIPVMDATQEEDAFFDLSINIGGNFGNNVDQSSVDDGSIFDNDFLGNDTIPDFTDFILDFKPTVPTIPSIEPPSFVTLNSSATSDLLYSGDPNLVSSCITEDDTDMHFHGSSPASQIMTASGECTESPSSTDTVAATHLELSDCNIELMDQFQLTDQIDLCSDDISLPQEYTKLFDTNSISILSQPLAMEKPYPLALNAISANSKGPVMAAAGSIPILSPSIGSCTASLLKSNQLMPPPLIAASTLPPIEMPTISVVKKCPMKASTVVCEVQTRKYPHIPAKRALIVNSPTKHSKANTSEPAHPVSGGLEPALSYSAWLEYVIETINESIDIVEKTDILHSFHVHEEIFAHFSKSFSVGIKRRMPNSTTVVKDGRHKGLIKYSWYFSTLSTVRRIFSTKSISLQVERSFECKGDGVFVPYLRETYAKSEQKNKRIYPKLALYMAHIWFDCTNTNHKSGFKLEWLPNAFPRSHFGILNIEFSIGVKNPHTL